MLHELFMFKITCWNILCDRGNVSRHEEDQLSDKPRNIKTTKVRLIMKKRKKILNYVIIAASVFVLMIVSWMVVETGIDLAAALEKLADKLPK